MHKFKEVSLVVALAFSILMSGCVEYEAGGGDYNNANPLNGDWTTECTQLSPTVWAVQTLSVSNVTPTAVGLYEYDDSQCTIAASFTETVYSEQKTVIPSGGHWILSHVGASLHYKVDGVYPDETVVHYELVGGEWLPHWDSYTRIL